MNENLPDNPQIQVLKSGTSGLFTNYIYKAIPLAFDESMSYYETLCGLLNYLKNVVIPTVNNNADAVAELQSLYEQLRTYVDDYFTNLDVQEEINNKLDALVEDGTLTTLIKNYIDPLIDEQNENINNFKQQVNSQLDIINNKVNSATSGSPLVASSTSEMTDTSRVYVNTTDGKWYWYDGDSWEIGGTYQSSGIANNSIDILKLDNDLQKNFFVNYSEPLDLGSSSPGYYQNTGVLVNNNDFINYTYPLENGKSYLFNGNNFVQSTALIIKDGNNNIIYASNPSETTGNVVYAFKVNENNLTAYISKKVETSTHYFRIITDGILREINNIYNQLRYSNNLPLFKSLNNTYLVADSLGINLISFTSSSYPGYDVKIYQASKGRKYKIHGFNRANVCLFAAIGLNNSIIYASSTASIGGGSSWEEVNYIYNCEQDGYLILTEITDSNHEKGTIEILNDGIEINIPNNLNNKKIGADGDSIMAGAGNNGNGYAEIIAVQNSMDLQNLSVGGGTIAYGTYSNGNPRHWICTSVLNLDSDCDFVLINGGINDWNNSVPLGEITIGYTSNLDNTTFYGGLETLCRNLLNKFTTDTKIYFVTNHNVHDIYNTVKPNGYAFKEYLKAIYDVMGKYGIEIIDIGKNTHLNTGIESYANEYTKNGDGIHPTEKGYNYFYVPYITSILKSTN